ncbi:PREDICTED: uncharacterized protein LOC108766837 [Trachymyrmex cornetzi]|uniref:uncharacterized protein LOC108766837 n=1 Tax=Trachymyrmex cornetzi TaxID=471704 RepID=UPI00084F27AD|nr:PREDICTED: uncharacterized protein LOC108766837 [Trachymyrmex cornetzi]
MERKLRRHAELSAQYNDFLAEYLALGHMSAIESPSDTALTPVYIPHHSVLRETSSTTKLRVVFNASCKTTNGTSLNDHLLVGPKLQQDLPAILLRWRQWRFVYAADIAKMFRQILVNNLDTDFQRILWRPSCDMPITHFRLLTVTIRRRLRDASDPFGIPESEFRSLYRLSRKAVRVLIEDMRPLLLNPRRHAVAVELQVLTALNFISSGPYQKRVGQDIISHVI